MTILRLSLASLLLVVAHALATAQCTFTPTVTGDTLFCPNTTEGMLSTQTYQSYQWYRRDFFNGPSMPIPNATQQTLAVTGEDVLFYFSVEATLNGCTERSAEVLLDGAIFLLPAVASTGDYTFNPNTQSFEICTGDTMFLELTMPYETSITWFFNGAPIPGETARIYPVTRAGVYTVQGAPIICPDFIVPLGLDLVVVEEQCTSDLPVVEEPALRLFPNPVAGLLQVESAALRIDRLEVLTATGQQVLVQDGQGLLGASLDMGGLPAGAYWVRLVSDAGAVVRKVVKQ